MSDLRFIAVLAFAALCLLGLGYLVDRGTVPFDAAGAALGMAAAYLFGGITPTDRVLGMLGIRKEVAP